MLLLAGLVLAVAFALLGVWLNAAAIVSVGEEISTPNCLLRGLQLYPTYLGLWALSNGCMVASAAAVFLSGWWLTRWTAESAAEMTFYWIVAGGALVGALLWFFFATVHDHARIRSRAAGVGAVRAFGWALAYVGRRQKTGAAAGGAALGHQRRLVGRVPGPQPLPRGQLGVRRDAVAAVGRGAAVRPDVSAGVVVRSGDAPAAGQGRGGLLGAGSYRSAGALVLFVHDYGERGRVES